jgi:hypothetical protein
MQIGKENLWLAALLFIILIVVINLVMVAWARGARGFKGKDFYITSNATKPWKKEDDDLRELHQRVENLKSKQKDKP